MNRRKWLKLLALGTGGVCLAGGNWLSESQADDSAPNRKRTARFAHLTDIHLYGKRNSVAGFTKALRHAQSLDDPPQLIVNGGDAIYDALAVDRNAMLDQWSLWKSTWKDECSLPVKHCLGNHDVWGWDKAGSQTTGTEVGWGKAHALEQLGLERSYYGFDLGGWRILVLDSITADDATVYRGELGEAQFDWVKQELESTPKTKPIALISHIPILTIGSVEFQEHAKADPRKLRMISHQGQDATQLVRLFRKHPNVKLCLSGHTHLTESISFSGVDYINSGAVSGLWWKGNHYHTDEGYNVIDLYDDGSCTTAYQSYGWTVG